MSISKKERAADLRRNADECERRGYPTIAAVNWEEAAWIDPPPRVPFSSRPQAKPAPITDIATARAKRTPLPVNIRKAS